MIPSSTDVRDMAPAIAEAAQRVVDEWTQDEDGHDELLGHGGACDLVADAMADAIRDAWPDVEIATQWSDVDTHTSLVAALSDGVHSIDVPARVYETGAGYVWRKIEGAAIGADDVQVILLDRDPDAFHLYVD